MSYDAIIIGAGIQGLILLDRLLDQGLTACCIDNNPHVGGGQTLRSQFYVHRGHFYTESDLIADLHDSYPRWQRLARNLGVKIRSTESYVGFVGDSSPWTSVWDQYDVPYTPVTHRTGILEDHRLAEVWQFPHMIFDGRELIAKLARQHHRFVKFGNITCIERAEQGYSLNLAGTVLSTRKIVVCAGAGTSEVLTKIPDLVTPVPVQNRACQVAVLRGQLPNSSIVIPDAKMFLAPQYDTDGSSVMLYTYGTDELLAERNRVMDELRVSAQFEALSQTLPCLHQAVEHRTVYLACKTESAELGSGTRPNTAFVKRIANDVVCVLPTKLSLAFNASDRAIALLDLQPSSVIELQEVLTTNRVPVALPPYCRAAQNA